jgi:hypothetical protein
MKTFTGDSDYLKYFVSINKRFPREQLRSVRGRKASVLREETQSL